MLEPKTLLAERLAAAFDTIEPGCDPVLRPSERDGIDFQANGALALAKRLGQPPREVAEQVLAVLDVDGVCSIAEVSGPGFINCIVDDGCISAAVAALAGDPDLGISPADPPLTVVVDYSAPNVAKEMHVGNLRSTIIGDALCRMLERVGHRVIRENHLGDWGTPFGMLIEHLIDIGEETTAHELSVGDLSRFYQSARTSFDTDADFGERSRRRVVLLQSGDEESLRLWKVLVAESVRYFDEVYEKLGVLLTDEDLAGESSYNALLPDVVADLDRQGLLVDDDGARCVFPEGFTNRDGGPLPLIVQKSDGGFGYAATDLAAIRDRIERLGAGRILYVIGAPQAMHLSMCFEVARMAGWLPSRVTVEHVSFGSVLGPDGKIFRTRQGESVKLVALLDEAVARAEEAIADRVHDFDEGEKSAIARAIGIGAIKYADLVNDRNRDYVFTWDRMLAFDGNTGPYVQYAHARIRSIFRRGEIALPTSVIAPVLADPTERALAFHLSEWADALRTALDHGAPSKLCAYLYDLAVVFSDFYERCPVLSAQGETRAGRLLLAGTTVRVLHDGLGLLGIEAPDRM